MRKLLLAVALTAFTVPMVFAQQPPSQTEPKGKKKAKKKTKKEGKRSPKKTVPEKK